MKKNRYLVVVLWVVAALAFPLGAVAAMNLRVDSISISGSPVAAGGSVQFTATVTNIGDEVTAAIVKVYLSPDAELTTFDDQMLSFGQSPVLSPGQSATVTQSVTIPARMATGDYFLGTITEAWSPDVSPADNVAVAGISVAGGSCTPDAFELDDTRASARPVGIDELQMRNHCDDPHDWMSFQAIAGTRYGIQASPVGYQSDMLTIDLFGADGTLVAQTPVNVSSDFPKLIWTAPETGVYFVRVRPYFGWDRVGPNTEYSFVIADALADLVVPQSDTFPKQGIAGGTDLFYTNVSNYGMVDSGPLEVGVHISASPNVTRADRRIGSRRIANLPPDRSMSIANVQIAFPSDLPAGTYYMAPIADDGNAVAEYEENNNVGQSTQVQIAGPSCVPDAYEDNDLPEMARPVAVGAQIPNNFCEDSFDWFSFEAQQARTYYLRGIYPAAYPGAPSQLVGPIEIYDLNGQLLAQGQGVVGWTAPQAGTYRALVRGGLSANTYYFGVLDQLPDLVSIPQWAMDTAGVPRGGVIDDGTWAVRNDGFADAPLSSLGLYFSADDVITRTDALLQAVPVPVIAPGAQASQTFLRVPVPRTQPLGTYYFGTLADIDNALPEVDETNNGYAIRPIQVYEPACAPDAYDDDDLPGQAKPLAIGETQSRNFCDDGWDWATVDLQAGATYAFETKGIIAGGPSRVLVYGTDAKTVLVDNNESFAALTAPAAGRYYVLATTLDSYGYRTRIGTSTSYTLQAGACQPDAFENDDADRTAGKPIAVGASQARNHCEDGVDWAALTLSAPGNYVIATSALGAAADTALEIHSATSTTPLASNDNASTNSKASSVTYNFAAAGTYYIKVTGKQRGAGTEYTLSVQPAKGRK